jgi:hypothetical protein
MTAGSCLLDERQHSLQRTGIVAGNSPEHNVHIRTYAWLVRKAEARLR